MTKAGQVRSVTVAELSSGTAALLAEAERGATIGVTRGGRIVATLGPPPGGLAGGGVEPFGLVREPGATYAAAPPSEGARPATALTRLIGAGAARAVLGVFLLEPARPIHQREIARRARVGLRSAQLALERLETLGLLTSERDGNRRYYRANRTEGFESLRALLSREFGLVEVLARCLEPVRERVRWAFIFGSHARGEDQVGSDVDLVVVGDVTDDELVAPIAAAQRELGRDIDAVTYRPREFADKRASGNHFVTSVLAEPRIDVIGSADDA